MTPERSIPTAADSRAWRRAAIALLVAAAAPFALSASAFGPAGPSPGMHAIAGPKDWAARTMASPKVVLVSGSSLMFGVDAPTLAARLGRPVANDALHAGIGIDLIAAWAAPHVRAGDVVIVAPEWTHFADAAAADPREPVRLDFVRHFGDPAAARRGLAGVYDDARARAIGRVEGWRVSSTGLIHRALGWNRPGERPIYADPTAFDDAGNLRPGRRPGPRSPAQIAFTSPDSLTAIWRPDESRAAVALDVLADACRRAGATLYAMPPVRCRPADAPPGRVERFEAEWLAFAARHAGARPLRPAGGTELPIEMVFDTEYHLNDRGASVMTERLASAIRDADARR